MVSAGHVAAGLSGVAWCNACIEAAGAGKGGGKPGLSNANIPCDNDAVLDTILNAANAFASKY